MYLSPASTVLQGDIFFARFSKTMRPNILVVEDDDDFAELITTVLKLKGYDVTRAFTVANVDSMGLVVRKWSQCSAGKSKKVNMRS